MTEIARFNSRRSRQAIRKGDLDNHPDIALAVALQGTTPDDPLAEPIVLFQMWKGRQRNECIRLTLSRFKGKAICDLRVYFTTEAGLMRPTKKGITFRIEKLPEIRKALEKAEARAIDLDLIEATE
jgi:hypothetical protein